MLPQTSSAPEIAASPIKKHRKKLLVAVALASGVTLECSSAGIGLFDSGLGCQATVGFTSSCAIVNVTTNCGVSVTCYPPSGYTTTCSLPTPASDCEVTVSFADGTQQKLSVAVYSHSADCGAAGVYGVALPLQCGTDAGIFGDAMSDAADDTESDGDTTD